MKITITEDNGVQHVFDTHSISIGIEGFGDYYSEDGCGMPVFLEEYEGVKLSVWADINKDDPTHQIDLSGAKESERKEDTTHVIDLSGAKESERKEEMKVMQLGDIQIEVEANGGNVLKGLERECCPYCGFASCVYSCDQSQGRPEDEPEQESDDEFAARMKFNGAMDGIESFVLALACEGVDIETPEFRDALKTACDACANNIV